MLEIKGKYTTAKIMIDDVEEEALKQIYNMASNISTDGSSIAIMPDVHAGAGSTVGTTITLGERVCAGWIGVDIGCGMLSVNIGNSIATNRDFLLEVDGKIRNVIPMGNNIQQRSAIPSKFFEKNFPWSDANDLAKKFIVSYNKKFNTNFVGVEFTYDWFLDKCEEIGMRQDAEMGIGTLGGGNHFIEFGKSVNTGDIWITVHTGSRNFGKMVCDYYMTVAKKNLENKRKVLLQAKIDEIRNNYSGNEIPKQIKEAKKNLGIDFEIDIKGMEYLEGQDAMNYFMDMIFSQFYSKFNRKIIIDNILKVLKVKDLKESIESIHNYINFEDMIIRKGAISSYVGQKMIIPFNMADGLLICEGKSNEEWNFSAPHGAGRIMSRGEASRTVDLEKFKYKMKGIVSTSVNKSTLDEAPQVYKNPKVIENAIEPTATIIDRVKPILNLKDSTESITWKEKRQQMKKVDKERKNERRTMRKMRGK